MGFVNGKTDTTIYKFARPADFKTCVRTNYNVPSMIIIVETQDLLPKLSRDNKDLRAQFQAFLERK